MATVIGSTVALADPLVKTNKVNTLAIVSAIDFAKNLPAIVQNDIAKALDSFDLLTIAPEYIGLIGKEQELAFGAVLDSFLDKIDEISTSKVGTIVEQLAKAVDKEDLSSLADRIIKNEPPSSIVDSVKKLFGKLNPKEIKEQFIQETKTILGQKTGNLKATLGTLEKTLTDELQKLSTNVVFMSEVQTKYGEHFIKYLETVVFAKALVMKSEQQAQEILPALVPTDIIDAQRIELVRGNLEKLQSRALALEGTLVNLPADNMVISQLRDACITTRQELLTTIPSKFNRIKMTIIKLNGALILKGVQDINEQSDKIDKALEKINSAVTKDVVTTASNMSGTNRLEQANHILEVVKDTKELMTIARNGQENNQRNFAEASLILGKAKGLLLEN